MPAVATKPKPSSSRTRARSAPRRRSSGRADTSGGVVALPRLGLSGLGALGRGAWKLPETQLIASISRGRIWIVVLAALLFGIVALNVSLLKLNSNISDMAAQTKTLGQQNAKLRARVAKLSSPDRIMRASAKRGMIVPPPRSIRYLPPYPKPTASDRAAAVRAASLKGR